MIDGGLIHLCNEIGYFVHYNIRGHSHIIMLWCFPPFLTPPPPMLYFIMFSIMKLWFFLLISLYQNIYLISTHTILQSIFGVYPTVFPNNVVLCTEVQIEIKRSSNLRSWVCMHTLYLDFGFFGLPTLCIMKYLPFFHVCGK